MTFVAAAPGGNKERNQMDLELVHARGGIMYLDEILPLGKTKSVRLWNVLIQLKIEGQWKPHQQPLIKTSSTN